MKVIVTINVAFDRSLDVEVRKCPPNYKHKECEWVLEVDDYSEEDIRKKHG